ncbi:hypothetical protein DPMN_188265 [Dreissena polymorpha]|uniref:Uncharacterized protein n=1 Tax=Dreissena polymorpha TaxID=45954 RepID=A0A9D4I9S4_DREPO|nr:hypothetical protein DPMN_188265 [Dreissena polymorpha]
MNTPICMTLCLHVLAVLGQPAIGQLATGQPATGQPATEQLSMKQLESYYDELADSKVGRECLTMDISCN